MNDVLIKLIENPKSQLLVFLFLVMLMGLPCYMSYRVEQAVIRLADKLECGQKIQITSMGGADVRP
jgi:hypothetical protein